MTEKVYNITGVEIKDIHIQPVEAGPGYTVNISYSLLDIYGDSVFHNTLLLYSKDSLYSDKLKQVSHDALVALINCVINDVKDKEKI